MIATDFSKDRIDQDINRRLALAKVYGLLVKLAEETEEKDMLRKTVSSEGNDVVNPQPTQLLLL